MKRTTLVLMMLVGLAAVVGGPALAEDAAREAAWTRPMPLFDTLEPEADVIYLLASSSVVFGPDPDARSEEITFAGFVTVPKWPMAGYQRRTLQTGQQQIDMELTESELVGESYLLGGIVNLGEHPDLRSLGTITERPRRDEVRPAAENRLPVGDLFGPHSLVAAVSLAAMAADDPQDRPERPVETEGRVVTYPITENLEKLMAANPYILWDDLIAVELRKLVARGPELQTLEPKIVPPAGARLVEREIELPPDLVKGMNELRRVDWRSWIYATNEGVAADLLDRQIVEVTGESFNPALIPNDFVVARKVLLTTAKGILYNETPVPVRGTITAIPPVRSREMPQGLNVFHGMELPVPLLGEDGSVNGWFYSKAHMAYAVEPDAIQRNRLEGTAELRAGERTETVTLSGPVEIHHTRRDGETEIEIMVLALRGRSELLGGDIMVIESFSDRDRFSSGRLTGAGGGAAEADLDLFVEVYTPSDKLANEEPIHLAGRFSEIRSRGELAKGDLSIPLLAGAGDVPLAATRGSRLFDEAGRLAAEVVDLHLAIAAD